MIRPCSLTVALTLALVSSARAQLPAGNWQYAWGDDFSGQTLDLTKWSYNYPWGTTHNHNATMRADHAVLGDGTLSLVAERTGTGANNFVSGAISSGYNNERINGGYIEARILLPDTPGSWPAFWGLDDGWPPECDIMEYPIDTAAGAGYAQTEYHTAFHYRAAGGGNAAGAGKVNPTTAGDLGGSYHTFGLHWIEDDYVGFYFNGNLVSSFSDNAAIAQMTSMYLIFNHAVGGWPGTPNTSEWPVGHRDAMKVDWVRIWRSAAAKTSNWTTTGTTELRLWDTAAHWTNGAPDLGGVTAGFGSVPAAAQRIDWSGRRTLGAILLDGATRYRFGWPDDRLVLGFGNGGSIQPRIHLAATSTTEHEIYAELEWSGTLNLENDSPHPLLLTGRVKGGDGIQINGTGPIRFDGEGSYTGTTVIDSGTSGPAVARARGSRPLGTGPVLIGQSGNATTARLELENATTLPNPISLNGRNNPTSGIVNLGGSNTFSNTITAQVGGSAYRIESAAGELRLAGTPAFTSAAGGTRTLTLAGNGTGLVSGAIENAGSATVSIVKENSGTWTLTGTNSYSGTTTVTGGTLVVESRTGIGPTTLQAGSTLAGTGTVRASLTALPGSTLQVGGILTVAGPCALAAGSSVEFDLTSPEIHDRLVIAGTLDASGTLRARFASAAPAPQPGDRFDLIAASGGTLAFSNYDLPPLPTGLIWDTSAIQTGVLAVATDPTTYAGWALERAFDPGDENPALDLDGDGLANAFEWLLGGDPHAPDPQRLPTGHLRQPGANEFPGADPVKHYLSLRATLRKDTSGMNLIPQAAPTLEQLAASASSANITSRLLNDLGDFEEREWTHTIPVGAAATGFIRLKLTPP